MNTPNKLKVEVWSDVVCPFCYIGKRHYEHALAQFEHADEVELEFKSYQLNPDYQQDSTKKENPTVALAKKYNRSIEEMEAMQENVIKMAKEAGLNYNLKNAILFNTFEAHRLLHLAKEKNLGNELEEALFSAYFVEGEDLGNSEVLKSVGANIGLSQEEMEKAFTDEQYAYAVHQDIQEAANLGVTGVPFFVFNRKYGVSGAQPVEAFLNTLKAAHADWKKTQPTTLENITSGPSCDRDGNCE